MPACLHVRGPTPRVQALGAVASQLPWPQYEQLLNQFMRLMKGASSRGKQATAHVPKAIIRSTCAIIDAFHFTIPKDKLLVPMNALLERQQTQTQATATAAAAPQQQLAAASSGKAQAGPVATATAAAATPTAAATATAPSTDAGAADADADADADMADADDSDDDAANEAAEAAAASTKGAASDEALATHIQRALLRRILPTLHEALVVNDEIVRAPVALAMVKLLKLLPPEAERVELPRALQGVCNLLRNRMQSVRDDARAVLVSMSAELGPSYVPYVCGVLRAALPDK